MGLISYQMINRIYELSKRYYMGQLSKKEIINEMVVQYKMNPGSVKHYIDAYCQMRKGIKYTRTIKMSAVEIYLERILNDDGKDILKIALESMLKSLEYYESLDHGNLPGIRRIITKYSNI